MAFKLIKKMARSKKVGIILRALPIEETDFWKEMQSNRVGNLLSGARLKANLSQAQLAEKLGIRQNMVSDYERGKRRLSTAMAKRIAEILHIKVDRIS